MTPEQFDIISRYRAYCAVEAQNMGQKLADEALASAEDNIERFLAGEVVIDISEYDGLAIPALKKRREELRAILRREADALKKDALQDAISKLDFNIADALYCAAKPCFTIRKTANKADPIVALGMKIG